MPKKRAVIIGKDVSKGARSPILWNAAYKALDIEAEMTPVDINSAEEAKAFLDAEITKPEFIGGAVARLRLKKSLQIISLTEAQALLSQKLFF